MKTAEVIRFHETLKVMTGSDAFILTNDNSYKNLPMPDQNGREFKLTLTICWEEYLDPGQPAGSLWLEYHLGKATSELPGPEGIVAPIPVQPPDSDIKTFMVVTRGGVQVQYNGQGKVHVWLSYYAEYVESEI